MKTEVFILNLPVIRVSQGVLAVQVHPEGTTITAWSLNNTCDECDVCDIQSALPLFPTPWQTCRLSR